ncbi:branched-chain amino acid ABC transporter permease [Enterovirga sp.]|uniref:branched-chain amino acid ABC transporter permease n=1 Tax=Enterovirga sp. TaxID=2026350 RepID=UPI002620564B|nr:branched-chain amino acid ABC transporter permease [Enterovirga sp.]MDB5592652.1 ABC-type transporter, integral rane subunit [Enterovirga sp.]
MSLLLYGLISGCVYGLWAASFSLIYRATRIFHVVHAAVFTTAAYGYWVASPLIGQVAAAAFALVLSVVLGVGAELLLYRPLARRGASAVLLFVVSLGAYIVVENTIQLIWGAAPRSVPVPFDSVLQTYVTVLGAGVSALELAEAGVALALWGGLVAFLRWTSLGAAIRAVTIAPELAELSGIKVGQIRVATFAGGSLLIGIAGLMMLMKTGIEPSSGLPVWVVAIVATLIGRASVVGSFVASIGMGLTESAMLIWFPAAWQPAMPVLILLGFLVVDAARARLVTWQGRRLARRNVAG